MNCFEFRRLLLTDPRVRSHEQEQHLAGCDACGKLVREMELFEQHLHDALRVPVPEALADRVLLRNKVRVTSMRTWALAASIVAALGIGALLFRPAGDTGERVLTATTLGPAHPGVAAISFVVDHESRLLKEGRIGDPQVLRDTLARLGLRLPSDGVTVRYLGKCPVPGGTGEHVVLQTALGQVTLILVPDHPLGPRITVADRQMTALVNPVRSGGYILIADSADHVQRIEKLLM